MTTFGLAARVVRGAAEAGRAARAERRQHRTAVAAARTRSAIATMIRGVLQLGALAAFTIAAWATDFRLGLLIGGLALFVAEYILGND